MALPFRIPRSALPVHRYRMPCIQLTCIIQYNSCYTRTTHIKPIWTEQNWSLSSCIYLFMDVSCVYCIHGSWKITQHYNHCPIFLIRSNSIWDCNAVQTHCQCLLADIYALYNTYYVYIRLPDRMQNATARGYPIEYYCINYALGCVLRIERIS